MAFFFLLSTIIFVTSASLLLLIFVPKMRAISKKGNEFSVEDLSVGMSVRSSFRSSSTSNQNELSECKRKLQQANALLRQNGIVSEDNLKSSLAMASTAAVANDSGVRVESDFLPSCAIIEESEAEDLSREEEDATKTTMESM